MVIVKTSKQQFQQSKERYNPFQTGHGQIRSEKDKRKDRNSKLSKQFQNELKKYCG